MIFRTVLIALTLPISLFGFTENTPLRPANPAADLVARAFADEKLPETGTLRFHVQVEGDDPASLRMREAGDLEYVDFSWAPGKKFRIDLMGKSGPIRSVVSDGKVISTGLNLWDARFAWDYEPHNHDINTDLRLKLDNEMWIYSHLLSFHLHPLSGFESAWSFKKYSDLYEMSVRKPEAGQSPNVTTVKLQFHRVRYFENLEIESAGDYVFAKSNQPPGNMPGGLAYQRSGLVEIAGVGRLPKTCVVTGKDVPGATFRWTSEVVADADVKPVDASMFDVKDAESGLILWPYGTRMNNFWYGIVDTIQDWWEGISDGVIGD